jgi:predicted ATP-dependent serine protease
LYLALEDNKRRLKSRLNKLFGSTEWPENFEYATEWPTAKEGGIAAIRAWVKSRPNARAVTVDVLERFRTRSRSGKENAYAADYETIKQLQSLASELNIAILVITHLRKGGDGDDPIEKISGTLGLSGGADTFLILDGNSNGQTLLRTRARFGGIHQSRSFQSRDMSVGSFGRSGRSKSISRAVVDP